jgi:hypothetical protein
LEAARWLVPLFTAYTAILAAAVLFRRQLQMIRLWYIRKHVVICGLGEKGWLLASQLKQSGRDVVVIEVESSNPKNGLCRESGIVVIEGDAVDFPILRKAAIHRANHLVSVCGDDGINAEVAMTAKELSQGRKRGTLNCKIHITNSQLCELLRKQEFGLETFPTFRLEMFNIYKRGATTLLSKYPPFDDEKGKKSTPPHILIIGVSHLGENLIIQAARSWYDTRTADQGLLRITVVDKDAEKKVAKLQTQFPKLPRSCSLFPVQMSLEGSQMREVGFLPNNSGKHDVNSIYICIRNQILGLQIALELQQRMNQNSPIVVRMRESSGLAKLLSNNQQSDMSLQNIYPFDLLHRTCTPDLVLGGMHEILAQAIHEDYLRQRLEEGIQMGQKRSMVHWYELPEDLRESNRRQVDHIRLKLHVVGYGIKPLSDWDSANYQFSKSEVEKMAKMEHKHWMQERMRNGWIFATGPEDAKNKTHPDLVPWERLPESVKEKDRQPTIKLPKLLAQADFQVYRLNEE